MQTFPTTSKTFAADQQWDFSVTSWDTPFTVLEGGVASGGIIFDLVEPKNTSTATWKTYVDNFKGIAQNISAVAGFTATSSIIQQVTSGRVDNLAQYWAAGAPGHHGATVSGRVAYHFRCYLRSTTGRAWFSNTATPSWFLALAGNGYFRIDKTVASTVTTLYAGMLTEKDFLVSGFAFTPTISNMAAGDFLDIYYIQTGAENWGGYTFKPVLGTRGTDAADQAAAQAAHILGCGLLDDNAPPATQTFHSVKSVSVESSRGKAMAADLLLPLVNPAMHDGTGWKWVETSPDDPGVLQLVEGGVTAFTLKRKRLIQIIGGFAGEQYTLFTGLVQDYSEPAGNSSTLSCLGFETKLLEQYDVNYPDPISYMTRGYKRTTSASGTSEPIYPIPAYDNWPLEYLTADLMLRNGIDASHLSKQLLVPKSDGTTASPAGYLKFRGRTLGGVLLRMERPVHYGNANIGFDESLPADDPYIFKPEITKEVWNRIREMSERLGYELRFDEFGDAVLRARNNPSGVYDIIAGDCTGSPTSQTNPSAFAAKYLEWTGATATVTKVLTAARIDLVLPLGPTLSGWTYTVVNSLAVTVASGTLTASGATADVYFFDGALNADASNATVTTLFSGDYGAYTVTLTATAGAATRRVDCFLLYNIDPMKPKFPKTLSTATNALKVQAQSAMDDMRNSVIVVGRRKATVTDSDKFNNPNNPESEFIVERLVDKQSITSPSATNFVGSVKGTIIYDSSITDNAYARYLARVFIYRYRNPRPLVAIDHTFIPQLSSGDSLYAEETRNSTVSVDATDARKSVLWTTGYKHTIEGKTAKTSVTTQSFPDFPAFEPREDIDLTAFNGKPVINVSVVYVSVTGETKTNLASSAAYQCVEGLTSTSGGTTAPGDWVSVPAVSVASGVMTIPSSNTAYGWPPVPGTLFIRPILTSPTTTSAVRRTPSSGTFPLRRGGVLPAVKLPYWSGITSVVVNQSFISIAGFNRNAGTDRNTNQYFYEINDEDVITVAAGQTAPTMTADAFADITWTQFQKDGKLGWVTNNPYHHFFNVDYRDSSRIITLVWNQGDASTMYQRATNATAFDVKYRRLGPVSGTGAFSDPYTGGSPFYDPYTSELGYTVNVKADFLLSGLYRVSIRNADDNTVVAWLTEPIADNTKPESHWQYFTAGAARQFAWDGVDNIGTWNQKQSTAYAAAASGAFEEKQRVIGAGFYAWNREFDDNKLGPMALIAGVRNATTGEPTFGHGTFAKWYVYIECKTDAVNTVVRTDNLDAANNGGSAQALIFTHLPEPTKAEVAIADWSSGTSFDPTDLGVGSAASALNPANWSTTPDTDATINNQKPVRLRFKVQQRPGTLWTGLNGEATVKLCRAVHLRANLMDQFVVYNGTNWPNSSFEDRAIYNRRLTNDEHTIKYEDDAYRRSSSLKWLDSDAGTEWVFYPNLFRKVFRGFEEAVVFGDYLQLEEVPKWDEGQRNKIAGTRSRMQIAFMNYLWYLSAYVSDRSGRSVWTANRQFLDLSKITANAYADWRDPSDPTLAATSTTYRTDWPADPMLQHRRTIITRQWADEKINGTDWRASQRTRWTFTVGSIGDQLLRHKWQDHAPTSTTINGTAWSSFSLAQDNYTLWHTVAGHGAGTVDTNALSLSIYGGTVMARQLTTLSASSIWTWETSPSWVPCITRDFHGYYMLPPMIDKDQLRNTGWQYQGGTYESVDMRAYNNTANKNEGADPGAGEVWTSPVYDMTTTYDSSTSGTVRFWPGHRVSIAEEPTKTRGVLVTTVDYVRQDELVHWEDLRGMFSRGKRPAEQPIKVSPVQPYYQNLYTYDLIKGDTAYQNGTYPNFRASVSNWFRMSFRSEYYWESGSLFPVSLYGIERLNWMNASKSRHSAPVAQSAIKFDSGAWVGWKDDRTGGGNDATTGNKIGYVDWEVFRSITGKGRLLTPFESDAQTVAVGPVLTQTKDMIFHMVLVAERRSVPV